MTLCLRVMPGQASEATLEKVVDFKRLIEEKYIPGKGLSADTFACKMKNRYAEYRASTQKQPTPPGRVLSEKYDRIKTGSMTYDETKKLLDAIYIHWKATNGSSSKPKPQLRKL